GGYDVYTTLDWNMQQLAEKEVKDHVDALKGSNVNNAALITMDPTTGEILAYVGSYDYYAHTAKTQGDYDHAGIALRQPGSTFKLFTHLTDMASAYQVIANLGVRVEPTMIYKIIDRNGKTVRDFSKPDGRQVLDPKMAWVFDDILKDNTDPNGSFVFGPWTNIGRPAALKTGTTDNLQDVLAIGFTP